MASTSNDGKGGGIPAWQRAQVQPSNGQTAPATQESSSTARRSTATHHHPDQRSEHDRNQDQDQEGQATLLKRAQTFLQDPEIRSAPMPQKRAFLESKGLDPSAISSLDLGDEPQGNREISSSPAPASSAHPTTTAPPQVKQSQSQSQSAAPSQRQQGLPRDVPPIITFPEHLFPKAQRPPPVVTTQALVNTAYIAAGVTAAVYGLSRFLLDPMRDTLTSARHDFAQRVQANISQLNSKLLDSVSIDPDDTQSNALPVISGSDGETNRGENNGVRDDDAGSEDSDPTELFHRDFGTQTSSSLLSADDQPRKDSTSTSSTPDSSDPTAMQATTLASLRGLCDSLAKFHAAEAESQQETRTTTRNLDETLESMAFPSVMSGGLGGFVNGTKWDGRWKKDRDETRLLKDEIRSFKGELLSARNFPATGQPKGQTAPRGRPA